MLHRELRGWAAVRRVSGRRLSRARAHGVGLGLAWHVRPLEDLVVGHSLSGFLDHVTEPLREDAEEVIHVLSDHGRRVDELVRREGEVVIEAADAAYQPPLRLPEVALNRQDLLRLGLAAGCHHALDELGGIQTPTLVVVQDLEETLCLSDVNVNLMQQGDHVGVRQAFDELFLGERAIAVDIRSREDLDDFHHRLLLGHVLGRLLVLIPLIGVLQCVLHDHSHNDVHNSEGCGAHEHEEEGATPRLLLHGRAGNVGPPLD
mmetsp:Transcript_15994/g.41364  ORF Transcript_15994/g.41364 Transcript_15994/m.41364 type:complete len:261 (-) Transcript_15994:1607-2389(-)